MRTSFLQLLALSAPLFFAVPGCGDDTSASGSAGGGAGGGTATATGTTGATGAAATTGTTTTGSAGTGGATTTSSTSTSTSTGSTGSGGAGSGGGAAGFPWEGAIDLDGGPSSSRLTPRPLGGSDAPQGYYEYLPSGYEQAGPDVKWPLLVFTHGIGENGNGDGELNKVLATGIPQIINNDNWPVDRPYVVLMPQHPGDGCPNPGEIQAMIAWGTANYAIDDRYVYLTGLSCGAIGAWGYLGQHLDSQIAAMVPIAGNGTGAWNSQGCELGRVAIWAFHGDADGTVDVSGTNVPMDGLAECPQPPALENLKTIYPGVGHNSWQRTYDLSEGHDIYTWMLGFHH